MYIVVDLPQDRLLLRFSVGGTDELHAFITRRMLRDMWPILMSAVSICKEKEGNSDPEENKQEKHQESQEADASKDQDFNDEPESHEPTFPLGSTPLLVGECVLHVNKDNFPVISFRETGARKFDITFSGEMMRVFCSMLKAAANDARWDLNLEFEANDVLGIPGAFQDDFSTQAVTHKLLH